MDKNKKNGILEFTINTLAELRDTDAIKVLQDFIKDIRGSWGKNKEDVALISAASNALEVIEQPEGKTHKIEALDSVNKIRDEIEKLIKILKECDELRKILLNPTIKVIDIKFEPADIQLKLSQIMQIKNRIQNKIVPDLRKLEKVPHLAVHTEIVMPVTNECRAVETEFNLVKEYAGKVKLAKELDELLEKYFPHGNVAKKPGLAEQGIKELFAGYPHNWKYSIYKEQISKFLFGLLKKTDNLLKDTGEFFDQFDWTMPVVNVIFEIYTKFLNEETIEHEYEFIKSNLVYFRKYKVVCTCLQALLKAFPRTRNNSIVVWEELVKKPYLKPVDVKELEIFLTALGELLGDKSNETINFVIRVLKEYKELNTEILKVFVRFALALEHKPEELMDILAKIAGDKSADEGIRIDIGRIMYVGVVTFTDRDQTQLIIPKDVYLNIPEDAENPWEVDLRAVQSKTDFCIYFDASDREYKINLGRDGLPPVFKEDGTTSLARGEHKLSDIRRFRIYNFWIIYKREQRHKVAGLKVLTVNDLIELRRPVQPVQFVTVELPPGSNRISAQTNEQLECEFIVKNLSVSEQKFSLRVSANKEGEKTNVASGWGMASFVMPNVTDPKTEVSIIPKHEQRIRVKMKVPAQAEGTYFVFVEAISLTNALIKDHKYYIILVEGKARKPPTPKKKVNNITIVPFQSEDRAFLGHAMADDKKAKDIKIRLKTLESVKGSLKKFDTIMAKNPSIKAKFDSTTMDQVADEDVKLEHTGWSSPRNIDFYKSSTPYWSQRYTFEKIRKILWDPANKDTSVIGQLEMVWDDNKEMILKVARDIIVNYPATKFAKNHKAYSNRLDQLKAFKNSEDGDNFHKVIRDRTKRAEIEGRIGPIDDSKLETWFNNWNNAALCVALLNGIIKTVGE